LGHRQVIRRGIDSFIVLNPLQYTFLQGYCDWYLSSSCKDVPIVHSGSLALYHNGEGIVVVTVRARFTALCREGNGILLQIDGINIGVPDGWADTTASATVRDMKFLKINTQRIMGIYIKDDDRVKEKKITFMTSVSQVLRLSPLYGDQTLSNYQRCLIWNLRPLRPRGSFLLVSYCEPFFTV
jgi:hypothetical protein